MINKTIVKNTQLTEEFFNIYKSRYPNLTIEQVREIVYTPWRFTKHHMESGELPKIRHKYFGVFQVYPGRAKHMLESIKQRFRFHKIEPEQYFKLKKMLEEFLKREDEKMVK